MSFEQSLEVGKIGESRIAAWLNQRGLHVLPVYEKEVREGKGPTLFSAEGKQHICPDLLAFRDGKAYWIEAKHKNAFSWHRATERFVTGIDVKHYQEYMQVQRIHPEWAIWLFFLHRKGTAKDTPEGLVGPSGLFGGTLNYLQAHENHRHGNWGNGGMVYWSANTLQQIAPLDDVMKAA